MICSVARVHFISSNRAPLLRLLRQNRVLLFFEGALETRFAVSVSLFLTHAQQVALQVSAGLLTHAEQVALRTLAGFITVIGKLLFPDIKPNCCGATRAPPHFSIRQHTPHTSAYVSIRQHTAAYGSIHHLLRIHACASTMPSVSVKKHKLSYKRQTLSNKYLGPLPLSRLR